MWERIQKNPILKQLQTHFKAKGEKGVGTQFPRVPAPLHPSGLPGWQFLGPNSRNLAFFEVVWHEKMVYGMYVIVWPFLMVLA